MKENGCGRRAVHRHDLTATDLKARVLDAPLAFVLGAEALDADDARARERRHVELHRLLGPAALVSDKHDARREALHRPQTIGART